MPVSFIAGFSLIYRAGWIKANYSQGEKRWLTIGRLKTNSIASFRKPVKRGTERANRKKVLYTTICWTSKLNWICSRPKLAQALSRRKLTDNNRGRPPSPSIFLTNMQHLRYNICFFYYHSKGFGKTRL